MSLDDGRGAGGVGGVSDAMDTADGSGSGAAGMARMEVDAADVLRLVMQFLREQGLHRSVRVVAEESGVGLNMVDDGDALLAHIHRGQWHLVLPAIAELSLPPRVLAALYEQIVTELVEGRDAAAAMTMLRTSLPLLVMRKDDPTRYTRLEHLVNAGMAGGPFRVDLAYPEGSNKDLRRHGIARAMAECLLTAPPSRLMALKWQLHCGALATGARYDIFRGAVPLRRDVEEVPVEEGAGVITMGAKVYPASVAITADGASLVIGSVDGIVEVYDMDTCKLRVDLSYQAADDFMIHDDAVIAMAPSLDGSLLATASKDGMIKVWRFATGDCLRRFPKAHGDTGVNSVQFNQDASQLLSSGGDGVVRVWGLRSGKMLKEFRGHVGPVTAAVYLTDGGLIATGGMDGTVRVWDTRTQDCLHMFRPPQPTAAGECPIISLSLVPRTPDHLAVVTQPGGAYIMSQRGAVLRTVAHRKPAAPPTTSLSSSTPAPPPPPSLLAGVDHVAAAVSPQGKYLYVAAEDRTLHCFNVTTGREECVVMDAAARDMVAVVHHPLRNLVVTIATDGCARIWKPAARASASMDVGRGL